MREILSAEFKSRLEALELALRRTLPAPWRGERRAANRKGISLEFSDHRNYSAGDDVRHLDWAGYARLDQLMIKVYHDEEDLQIHVLVDDSASMNFGEPSKALFARQVAAALVWIGLSSSHRTSLAMLGDSVDLCPRSIGRAAAPRFFEKLASPPREGRTPLAKLVEKYVADVKPRGLVFLISDFFDRAGPKAVMKPLEHPSRELNVVHVLAADEVRAPEGGDFKFKDSETGHIVEVNLSPSLVDAYEKTVKKFVAETAEVCRRRGSKSIFVPSDSPLEDFCLRTLVREGMLR